VGVTIEFQSLAQADWSGRELADAEVRFCDLRGAVLTGAAARGSFWQHCSLRGADLAASDLVDAVFSDCLLERASLRGARLARARLVRCSFEDADLSEAGLRDATTVQCSFDAARLDGVRDVATARDLVVEILRRAAGDDPELLRWVGLVALERRWCYEEWARELAGSPRHRALALEAFAAYPAAGFADALNAPSAPDSIAT
jgi:hypothetical protein